MSAAPKIQFTNKLSAADGIKCVVYGASGVGKTSLAATAQSPLILSAEKGLLSVRKFNIPYIDISTHAELVAAFTWVMQSNESRQYSTLVLDSLSEIAEVVLSQEKKNTKDPRKAYGAMQDSISDLCRAFRDAKGRNVVLICKQMLVDEGMSKKAVPVMPSQSLQASLPYFWDQVLHMYSGIDPTTQQSYRAFHTTDTPQWNAKDRSGNLAEAEPADLTYLFAKACA